MHGLRDALERSKKDHTAIGHFNVSDWVLTLFTETAVSVVRKKGGSENQAI